MLGKGKTDDEGHHLYFFGPFCLDAAERRLFNDGRLVLLKGKAFDLLWLLIAAAGHLQTREQLLHDLWPDTIVTEHSLTTRVSTLRKALDDEGQPSRYVETVHGYGYRFIAPVEMRERTGKSSPVKPRDSKRKDESAGKGMLSARRRVSIGLLAVVLPSLLAVGLLFAWNFSERTAKSSSSESGIAIPVPAASIAVLPFENLSADRTNAYFVQGIQDMILTKLADIGKLKVISRISTEHYGSHPANLQEIARALNVATILEGSVQKTGKKVLINVQLINARSGNHIWAQAYARTLSDVFGVESEVAAKVAVALRLKLLPAEVQHVRSIPTQNFQAYILFLKGEYERNRSTRTGSAAALKAAIRDYRQAVEQDPDFALAYAQLARALVTSYHYGYNREPGQLVTAKVAADRALTLAPDLAKAHIAKAIWYYLGKNNSTAALDEFKRALALKSQDPIIHLYIGSIYRQRDHWNAALREMSAAAALDPQNVIVLKNLAITYAALRRYRAAINVEKRAVAIDPTAAVDAASLSIDYLELGDIDQALAILDAVPDSIKTNPYVVIARIQALILKHDFTAARKATAVLSERGQFKNWFVLAQKANVLWLAGRHKEAQTNFKSLAQMLRKALAANPDNPMLHAFLGIAYVRLGLKAKAIKEGRRAVAMISIRDNAFVGPTYLENLAEIYAQTDEPKKAMKILSRLMAMPAGAALSVPLLELDPVWDPIRKNPAFQTLLSTYEKKPLPSAIKTKTEKNP